MTRTAILMAQLLVLASAHARTITLTDNDVTKMAVLSARVPEAGWASYDYKDGSFASSILTFPAIQGILIQFPIDAIPRGYRVVNAELCLPVTSTQPDVRISVWRVLPDWGPGVCHLYRRELPSRAEWSVPGAMGSGVDRAVDPTGVFKQLRTASHFQMIINVTKDVELWHSRTTPNNGWVITSDNTALTIHFKSPIRDGQGLWQLKLTYEPL